MQNTETGIVYELPVNHDPILEVLDALHPEPPCSSVYQQAFTAFHTVGHRRKAQVSCPWRRPRS